jgi:outer membrane protein assembly factor BamB
MATRRHAHKASGVRRRRAVLALLAGSALVLVIGVQLAPGHSPQPSRAAVADGALVPAASAVDATATPATPSSSPTATPAATPPATAGVSAALPPAKPARFPGGLLIADRGNGRLIAVNDAGRIIWSFPRPGSLPRGQQFAADDAFIAPDGKTIVANDEAHQVIDRIDIATRRIVWQYGRYDTPGGGRGELHTPDDAYPLANGDIVVADIRNCRILQIDPAKRVVRQWGRTGVCRHDPPRTFDQPNGDTPLPDGGLLITEITGSRVVRLGPDGRVRFDVHVPVSYPSDAQLAPDGSIVVVDYARTGAVVRLSPKGRVLWRYRPTGGARALSFPSLAVPLPNGTIVLNDDERSRVVVIDPRTNRIVWQYGRTDRPGRSPGHLDVPDGLTVAPPGVFPGT